MEQQPKQGAQAGSRTRQKPPFPTPPETIVDRKRGKQYVRQEVLGEGGFARCYAVSEVGTGTNIYYHLIFAAIAGVRYAAKIIPKASLKSSKQKAKVHLARPPLNSRAAVWRDQYTQVSLAQVYC